MLRSCYRPDRCYNAAKLFVIDQMGEKEYVQPPVLDYKCIYNQSTTYMPIVFVLSPGADPQSDIQALGLEMGSTGNSSSSWRWGTCPTNCPTTTPASRR